MPRCACGRVRHSGWLPQRRPGSAGTGRDGGRRGEGAHVRAASGADGDAAVVAAEAHVAEAAALEAVAGTVAVVEGRGAREVPRAEAHQVVRGAPGEHICSTTATTFTSRSGIGRRGMRTHRV